MPDTVLKSMHSAITYSCSPRTQKGHEEGHKTYSWSKLMDVICFVENVLVPQLSLCVQKDGEEYICVLHNTWIGSLATVHIL